MTTIILDGAAYTRAELERRLAELLPWESPTEWNGYFKAWKRLERGERHESRSQEAGREARDH